MVKIEDGTGTGFTAQVDTKNRLKTNAIANSEGFQAARDSDAYSISSGVVNLTSASASAVLFVKNTEDRDLVIENLDINQGDQSGGPGAGRQVEIIKNPAAGTIVSAGVDVTKENKNFGSSKVLDATAKKGVEGSTITDGSTFLLEEFSENVRKNCSSWNYSSKEFINWNKNNSSIWKYKF